MAKEFRQNENYETIKKDYVSPTVDVQESEGKGNRYSLPYGLCKGEGIDTTGMTPREAWEAYTNKTGISKEQAEKEHWEKEEEKTEEPKEEENETPESTVQAPKEESGRRQFQSKLSQINEYAAQRSREATSFFGYEKGSATAEYNRDVSRFDANVNALIEKYKDNDTLTDNDWERVYALADKYASNRASFTNEYNRINSSHPSWFIAGPANYNTRKNEKKMNAIDNVMRNQGANIDPDKNEYLTKIKAILSNQNIKSDDSNAVGKLQAKYDGLKAELERGKEMNAYFRKNKTLVGFPGISEKTAKDFDERNKSGDIFASQPFASYRLQNGNAELRRIQQRIDSLNKIKESAETGGDASANYPKASGVTVQENAQEMRVQLRFDGKPDEETRTMLKSWGFRWSPSQGAWQRQLTGNGKYAAKQVMQKLSEKEK